MGIFGRWLARIGNVGGTARAVALGWNTIRLKNPNLKPIEIAELYIKIRYAATGEVQLSEKVLAEIKEEHVSPFDLAWKIFSVENDLLGETDGVSVDLEQYVDWQIVMKEELKKAGL